MTAPRRLKLTGLPVVERGSVYVEYVTLTLVLLIFMFARIPGHDLSAVDWVIDSLREFYRHTLLIVSLP